MNDVEDFMEAERAELLTDLNRLWAENKRLRAENERMRALVVDGIEAFRLTREYLGDDALPAVDGWSWFDWVQRAIQEAGR
jgi:hypothetical protein